MTTGNISFFKCLIVFQLLSVVEMDMKGPCVKEFSIADNLDVTQIYGHWFEYSRTARMDDEQQKCVQYDFDERSFTTGEFKHFYIDSNSDSYYNNTDSNIVNKDIKGMGATQLQGHSFDWKITYTDYNNYAIYYGCDQANLEDIFWILKRQQYPNESVLKQIENNLNSDGFSLKDMKAINQEHCEI